MKYLIILAVVFCSVTISKAQLAVIDAGLNKKLLVQTQNNSMTLAYENIKTEISKGSLKEALTLASQVGEQYKVINEVYTIANNVQNLKRLKNFYIKASIVNTSIAVIARYLAEMKPGSIPNDAKDLITKGLTSSVSDMSLAFESLNYGLNLTNKMSLQDRLSQIDNASNKLTIAANKLQIGSYILKSASDAKEMSDKKDYYYKLKYGIN